MTREKALILALKIVDVCKTYGVEIIIGILVVGWIINIIQGE